MTSKVLNGGAINAVSFPGATAGPQLVEMIGTVQVTGLLSAISFRRITGASATAYVYASVANTTNRAQVLATTTSQAQVAALVRSKVKVTPVALSAYCSASVVAGAKRIISASATCSAVTASGGANYVRRSASATASASTAATARTNVIRLASATSQATAYAFASRKSTASASATAAASSTTSITLSHRLVASTAPTANGSASSRVNIQRAASTLARAAPTVFAARARTVDSAITAQAVVVDVFSRRGVKLAMNQQAVATTAASIVVTHRLSAATTGQAIAASAAADYSTNQPAPLERQMIVPAFDRRMEVTT